MKEKLSADEALTPREAAKVLGISVDRLRYLRNHGRVKGVEIAYNITLYRPSDLRNVDISAHPRGRKSTDKQTLDKSSDVRHNSPSES